MAIHETTSSDTVEHGTPVVARPVEDSERINTLPRHFGNRLLTLEGAVCDFMRRFSPDYRGGFWDFIELSNGGFYMAPQHEGLFRFSGTRTDMRESCPRTRQVSRCASSPTATCRSGTATTRSLPPTSTA